MVATACRVCSIFGTLIADGERLYDPRLYHDRLLLGLTGMMSEAELHHLKQRMHAGAYVYGRTRLDPTKRSPAHPRGGVVRQPIDTWEICLHNRYPAYIAWEEFLANQAQ